MATIKDVARLSGTSVSSVSKVLRNKEIRITDQKRQQIIDAAHQLQYVPNSIAANLKSGRINTVAVLCPDLSDPYYPKLAKNIMLRLEPLGQKCLIYDYNRDPQKALNILLSLQDFSAGSIVLLADPVFCNNEIESALQNTLLKIPVPVLVVDGGKLFDCDVCITYDRYLSGQMIAQHLLEMGHRQIGVIAAKEDPFYIGILDTVRQAGQECYLAEHHERFEGGYEACQVLLRQAVTAVAASSDQLAIGALSWAMQAGLQVPQQLAVTGMGDLAQGRIFPIPITTVRFSAPRLAQQTVEMLMQLTEKQSALSQHTLLTPKLLIRQSSNFQKDRRTL